jgi:hypothetical protein
LNLFISNTNIFRCSLLIVTDNNNFLGQIQ